jgi:hypothetical protein
MKKSTSDKGNDNGPFSSNTKTGIKSGLSSKDQTKSAKADLQNHPATRTGRLAQENDLTKKSGLKYGSRRNLL